VSPLAATLCLLLVYGIGRELGMTRTLAATAAACLAVFPSFFWFGLQPMSDVPATAWVLAAMFTALRARRSAGAAYLSGAAFGMAVLVRPTNILLAVPLLLALPLERRTLLRFALSSLPFAAFLLLTNQIANGSPFRSGYGDMSSGFSLGFFPVRIRHYGYWLSALGTPFLVLGWLAVAGVRSLPRRDRLMLVAWPAVFVVFFCCWQPYETWWYTRFLLPAVPAMILAMFFVVARGFRPADRPEDPVRAPRSRKILSLALSVVVLATGIFWIRRFQLVDSARGEEIYPDACRWAAALVPPDSVIAAIQMTGAMRYYTGSTFARIDWIEPAAFPALRKRVRAAGYHWYALVSPAEKELLGKNLPGAWKEVARLRDQTLLRLEDAAPGDLRRSGPPAGLDPQPPAT
jgi:4-amino-4-deoxy-L-arabinose transferase-like glycosyltransferase